MQAVRNTLILSLSLAAGACVAFYPPDEDDDGVERCESSTDCKGPAYDDSRIVGECVEAAEDSAPKVCVAAWAPTNCNGMQAQMGSPLRTAYDAVIASDDYPSACSDENLGKPGCAPNMGECDAGMPVMVGSVFVCPHPNAADGWVAYPPSMDRRGLDVLDQACRHFFCDRTQVCNTNGFTCEQCDPDKPIGEGGCAEMYVEGELAPALMTKSEFEMGDPSCGNRAFGIEEAFPGLVE